MSHDLNAHENALEKKVKRRAKKRRPSMRVSGKGMKRFAGTKKSSNR